MNWIGRKTYGCTHHAQFDPDEILAQRNPWEDTTRVPFLTADGRWLKVRMNSIRYHCFARSKVCACCGRIGTVMMLDVHGRMDRRAHFNLYAVEGDELILMTRDHILPLSQGGKDTLDNIQTLCTKCNQAKGDRNIPLNELREIVGKAA
ncbi:MAG: HNH endonuclease [Thermoguttaceae bacterium]